LPLVLSASIFATGFMPSTRAVYGKIAAVSCKGASMPTLVFDIALSAERLRVVYQGHANRILVQSRDGRSVSVPAHYFRRFLTHDGVYGSFELEFSTAGKLLNLKRLG
jgi:hypothetical protein